ncbi:hypothetical protein T4E_8102 [Trichinella pseudospiralis]|uniref:Uncharacterized protein n=1 Tax=Trichinella pseudospiralis TaxID=6337 RepID=A0A0V0XR81_TRIPS|nr:hypothetical protein T4E_8102 [Trichinella pseudospiralis]
MCTKMKTVQEHFLNISKALKPTENAKINACVFIIARQFLQIEYLLRPDMPMKYNLSCITVMFYRGNNIVHARRRDHLMWRRYWSQVILDHMAQKGTKRQFDISGKPGFLFFNYPEGLAKCRGHCSNTLYINMLAIEHEEYSIVISETFNQADGKLN